MAAKHSEEEEVTYAGAFQKCVDSYRKLSIDIVMMILIHITSVFVLAVSLKTISFASLSNGSVSRKFRFVTAKCR